MIRRFLVLIFAVTPLAAPLGASAQTLSRVDAVKAALDANPDVVRAREDLRSLEGKITEVKADALPEVTFRANTNRYRDPALLNSSSFDSFPIELRDSLKPIPANLTDGSAEVKQTIYSFKLGRALKVGGHAIIATFALDGPERCSGLPVVRYDAASLGQTLGSAFQLVETRRHAHATPWGTDQSFQFSVFRRCS